MKTREEEDFRTSDTREARPGAVYVCNAGLLLDPGRKLIGIDVFARDPNRLYTDTPPVWKARLMEEIRRGRLGLLVISHAHGDHYCREDVLEAVLTASASQNPMKILTTEETARGLLAGSFENSGAGPYRRDLEERLIIAPKNGEEIHTLDGGGSFLPKGVRIRYTNTVHDGKEYSGVQNLMLLMELPGAQGTIHAAAAGDASPTKELFERIAGWCPRPDWMFVPFPYGARPLVRKRMEAVLKIGHLVLLHFPREEMDEGGWYESCDRVCREAADTLPSPVFFRKPGEKISFYSCIPCEKML